MKPFFNQPPHIFFLKLLFTHFLLLFSVFLSAQTQKNIDKQSILWTRYYNQLTINNNWSIHSELDNRIFLKPVVENLFVCRVQGRYKFNSNFETGAGIAYFSVFTQNPDQDFNFEIPEFRMQQDVIYKVNFNKLILNQRIQVEERFIHNATKTGLVEGTTFSWRFRYRLQAEYPFWEEKNQYLKGIVYDEILLNAGKNIVYNTFDQNRIYAALQYGINKKVAVEVGYLKSFQQRPSGIDYFDRDIIRVSFFHKLHL